MAAERSRAMEEWKQEVINLRQQGKEEAARHMNMIGEAVHAVQVEAMGGEGMEGMMNYDPTMGDYAKFAAKSAAVHGGAVAGYGLLNED